MQRGDDPNDAESDDPMAATAEEGAVAEMVLQRAAVRMATGATGGQAQEVATTGTAEPKVVDLVEAASVAAVVEQARAMAGAAAAAATHPAQPTRAGGLHLRMCACALSAGWSPAQAAPSPHL